jgi:hypothetical protein
MVEGILGLSTTVVHVQLVAAQTLVSLADLVTIWKGTLFTSDGTRPSVHNDEGQQASANLATKRMCRLTGLDVDKELLHLDAVVQATRRRTFTVSSMGKYFQICVKGLCLVFLFRVPLVSGLCSIDRRSKGYARKCVGPLVNEARRATTGCKRQVAILAQIKVWAYVAVEFVATDNVTVTRSTLLNELWRGWVVQLKEHHHGRVLCSSHFIKLTMIGLTIIEKKLTIFKHFALELLVLF